MKSRAFFIGSVAAGMALLAGTAYALGPGGQGWHGNRGHGSEMSFEQLDADGSGEISAEEFAKHREARFAAADANGDGKLDRDELIARMQKRMSDRVEAMIGRFDTDGDGALSAEEMPGRNMQDRAAMFEQLDSDNSGGLSQQEMAAARDHKRGGMKHRRHGNGN